jgi:hypothetical protein
MKNNSAKKIFSNRFKHGLTVWSWLIFVEERIMERFVAGWLHRFKKDKPGAAEG